ncbi:MULTISPECIES: M1 family metallopeptidase [Myxococcaceae]|uniref:M1 family metallopeptidase n=1 Tax=Myxococcaceae TaxID=31 RepID=UPI00188ED66A|nr:MULTISPECIES: M1 family metallopeptidase [Myxococcaceae]MBF5042060.1 M1 family metallopeptidase [Simulacricoccus sp. 17bor-14]
MDYRWRKALGALVALSLGCASSKHEQQQQPAPQPAPQAQAATAPAETPPVPTLRLDPQVRPSGYELELTVDPNRDQFAGVVKIALELPQATRFVWLNGQELEVQSATIAGADGKTSPARAVKGSEDFIGFGFEQPVGPGKATLEVKYTGRISDKDSQGLFRQKEGGDWYAFSQFEPDDARRVLPSFDEPSFKVPFQLTLKIPMALQGYSNTPVEQETPAAGGFKKLRFARTKPLPSYLLAFGVGPLEAVDAGRAGKNQVPVRIIVPHGRAAEAAYAAKVTGPILGLLEDYFGIPYPYEKLDQLSIPIATGWGAMENAGLVTYVSELILAKPEQDTLERQRIFAEVAAHELAHQWFGDLVTMPWWNDIWLNESFASWMEVGTIDKFAPDWGAQVEQVKTRNQSMKADSLATARVIRQKIENRGDIRNAFDGITYGKGASVLTMFESYLGKERFQAGIHRYMQKHAYGNATADDFLASISEAAGRDVAPMFSTYLQQAGVPRVSMKLACEAGQKPTLQLSQRRYLPTGSKGSSEGLWQVPVCVRYGQGAGKAGEACTLLTEKQGQLVLEDAKGCPDWVMPNAQMKGYYRALLEGDGLARLMKQGGKQLSLPERVGLLGDAKALTASNDLPAADTLTLAQRMLPSDDRELVTAAMSASSVNVDYLPQGMRPNYERFLRKTYGPEARKLGLSPKKGESQDQALLRPEVLWTVAYSGRDPQLAAQSKALALKWLTDRSAVDPALVPVVLHTAALGADEALHGRMLAEAKKSQDRRERGWLLEALGAVRDPKLVAKNLQVMMGEDFDLRESYTLLSGPLEEPTTRQQAYDFFKENYDALVARFPRDYGAYLTMGASHFCDAAHREDVQAFFGERTPKLPGGKRVLAQTLETVDLCIAQKAAQGESLGRYLAKY